MYGFPRNTEITEKKIDLEEALSRTRLPIDSNSVTMEVFGTYALPEAWKSKVVSYRNYLNFLNDISILK